MIKVRYKVFKHISYRNKNSYKQFYWFGHTLSYKGYYKYYKYIRYQESYIGDNIGIKYIV